ncbi:unnamed protein product, partial [Discosporangium mesarthrocarpum]
AVIACQVISVSPSFSPHRAFVHSTMEEGEGMEELLGLTAGDFQGVEEVESDSDGEPSLSEDTADKHAVENGVHAEPLVGHEADITRLVDSGIAGRRLKEPATSKQEGGTVDVHPGNPIPELATQDATLSLLYALERCCLEMDVAGAEALAAALPKTGNFSPAAASAATSACLAAVKLCRGDFQEVLKESEFLYDSPAEAAAPFAAGGARAGADPAIGCLRSRVVTFILAGGEVTDQQGEQTQQASGATEAAAGVSQGNNPALWRSAEVLWAAAAALNLFLQQNYTGPELGEEAVKSLEEWFMGKLGMDKAGACMGKAPVHEEGHEKGFPNNPNTRGGGQVSKGVLTAQALANVALSCDGELPYPLGGMSVMLLLSRTIFVALMPAGRLGPSTIQQQPWGALQGMGAESSGGSTILSSVAVTGVTNTARVLSSLDWWAARAVVTHARLMLSSDELPTIREEGVKCFRAALGRFG